VTPATLVLVQSSVGNLAGAAHMIGPLGSRRWSTDIELCVAAMTRKCAPSKSRLWQTTAVDELDHRVERLRTVDVFRDVPAADLRMLVAQGTFRNLRREDVLWRQGKLALEVAVVWGGRLAVYRDLDVPVSYRVLVAGQAIGYSNAIARTPCSVHVKALEDTRLLLLPGDAMRNLIAKHPFVAYPIIAALGALVARLSDEIEQLHGSRLESRIMARLRILSDGRQRVDITNAELGGHVGATRESVSRALKLLHEQGSIERGRGWIAVVAADP
jgi:CRP/FNR family transcriptional regulator, cyclic AMP receptor protein